MSKSAAEQLNEVQEAVNLKTSTAAIKVTTGVGAAGASSTPTGAYPDWLASNGFLFLSWADWIRVIGAIYVLCLLVSMFYKGIIKVREWVQEFRAK